MQWILMRLSVTTISLMKKNKPVVSGGSDFHGSFKPQIRLKCSWVNQETNNTNF